MFASGIASAQSPNSSPALDAKAVWRLLGQGGHVILIRHALAPGTFDPPGFVLDDCKTQRNLSDEGRAQAKALGRAFADNKVPVGAVKSSQWCRCLETAELAFGKNKVQPFALLNSPTRLSEQERKEATQALKKDIVDWTRRNATSKTNQVYVTHQFKIRDLLGVSSDVADLIVVKEEQGDIQWVGRITIN